VAAALLRTARGDLDLAPVKAGVKIDGVAHHALQIQVRRSA
jgi:hypothetical protein